MDLRRLEGAEHGLSTLFQLDDINEHAGTLGYGLVTMLAARAMDLVMAMTRPLPASVRVCPVRRRIRLVNRVRARFLL